MFTKTETTKPNALGRGGEKRRNMQEQKNSKITFDTEKTPLQNSKTKQTHRSAHFRGQT